MTYKTGSIRKNASKKIAALLDMAESIQINNYTYDMYSDCYTYDDAITIDQDRATQFIADNYRDVSVYLVCNDQGEPTGLSSHAFSGYIEVVFAKDEPTAEEIAAEQADNAEKLAAHKAERKAARKEKKTVIRAYSAEYYEWLNSASDVAPAEPEQPDFEPVPEQKTKYCEWLETLITEKGKSLDDTINIAGDVAVFGFTYRDLVDLLDMDYPSHQQVKNTLVEIDFKNGNVFHFLDYLANKYFEDKPVIH